MDRIPERLRFNFERETSVALGGSTGSDTTSDHIMLIPSDDPLIDLRLNHEGVRTDVYADGGALKVPTQRGKLGRLRLVPEMHDPFGPSIDWAYRCYEVLRPADDRVFRKYLYLFNVLVALEWQPDEAYLEQLKTAFRRASDFLFDVTDGWMAFGQVVFGGPELMDSADIQIMASTRLHPRSWVGGMHPQKEYANDEKYMPIRLGRGVWNDNRCGIIPWVEPEGYRIIIHEWGHHALKLTDEYLEIRQLLLSANAGLLQAGSQALVAAPPTAVVMLKVATTTDSVMATTEGTSELVSKQWSKVSELFPSIPDRLDIDVREGPGHLPAALPRFRRIEAPKSAEKKAAQQFFSPPGALSARRSTDSCCRMISGLITVGCMCPEEYEMEG